MQNILYLSRYYPPEISGGARRANALIHELRKRGFVVKLGAPIGAQDSDLIGAKHPIFPSNSSPSLNSKLSLVGAIANFMRKNLLLPDPEIRWALRLVREVKQSQFVPDIIIASGPPESLYIAGELLRRHFGAKLIIDMRDPWINPPQRLELANNIIRTTIETQIGKHFFSKASGLIGVSRKVLDDGIKLAPSSIKTKIIGHFAHEFIEDAATLPQETFNLVHTGAISLSNPLSEFAPMLCEFENVAMIRKDLKLWLAGRLSNDEIAQLKASNARSQIEIMGPVSMDEARALQLAADALLIVSGTQSHALPGKYSEYSMCDKPIIVSQKGEWCKLLPQDCKFYEMTDLENIPKNMAATYPHESVKKAADNLLDFIKALN